MALLEFRQNGQALTIRVSDPVGRSCKRLAPLIWPEIPARFWTKLPATGKTVAVERNHILIAKIVPPERTMTAAQALNGLKFMLTPTQAAAWLKDSKESFDQTVRDPWA